MKSQRRWFPLAAATVILLIAGLWWINNFTNRENLLVFSTVESEKKDFTLADGTLVSLNENSRLSYPAAFENPTRMVKFSGEAYFDIAKNPSKPFIIQTTDTKVEVVGTEFNLRAYPTEVKTEILVSAGKVNFQEKTTKNSIVLIANQQGIFANGKLKKVENPKTNTYAWKSGVLSYKDTPLKDVLLDLERVFKIKTELQNQAMGKCTLSGQFPNAQPNAILKYAATFLKMELVEVAKNQFRLKGGGTCE